MTHPPWVSSVRMGAAKRWQMHMKHGLSGALLQASNHRGSRTPCAQASAKANSHPASNCAQPDGGKSTWAWPIWGTLQGSSRRGSCTPGAQACAKASRTSELRRPTVKSLVKLVDDDVSCH